MKKRTLLITSSLALLLGLGVVGGLSANLSKKAEKVVKADTSTTLYINQFDGGGNWNNFSYYLFDSADKSIENAPWPGVAFTDDMKTTTPNELDQYQYVLTINTSVYDTLILVGNPQNWGGSQAQTEDLVIADMPNNGLYSESQIPDTNKFEVGYYGYTTKTVYLLDLKGDVYSTNHYCHTFATGKSGTSWPGVAMTKVAGHNNIYSAEINSHLDNVIFNNNGTNQTDTIPSVAANDVYIVYPDNGYNKTDLDSAYFIDQYMKFETVWLDNSGTGACKASGWYSSAKSAFSSKTAEERQAILAHEPTADRLTAWAAANGDTLNVSNGTLSRIAIVSPLATVSDNNNGLLIIVLVSVGLASMIAGYFLLRRKKQK